MYYVYILKSLRHRFCYVGTTKDVQTRLQQHNGGL
jgi:predicted GIY-YIG superfamily endonuclease